MASPSPLLAEHESRGAMLLPYGPAEAGVDVPQSFGSLELEYAALRTNCVLLDCPERGTLEIIGPDRLEFLGRMLTQELKPLVDVPGSTVQSFWLNRKGRIDADITLVDVGDRTLMDLDVHAAAPTAESLGSFLFAEDAQLNDVSRQMHRLAIIGPTAPDLLRLAVESVEFGEHPASLEPRRASIAVIADGHVVVDRSNQLGVPEFGILVESGGAARVYRRLMELGSPAGLDQIGEEDAALADDGSPASTITLRPAGWHAYNIARIEAGLPLFNIDFGPESLPAETGVIAERVSFAKGCYLGQEIVARMQSLGHAKQVLVALRCEKTAASDESDDPVQPATGSVVLDGASGDPVGAVTSATLSPMLGGVPICFAAVRWDHHEPGTKLAVGAEGRWIKGRVQESLRFI